MSIRLTKLAEALAFDPSVRRLLHRTQIKSAR